MSEQTHRQLTFAILDRDRGIPDPLPSAEEEFPLPAWYRAVRDTPLEQLTVEDISKACRQQIHLDHVVPRALHILQTQPLAGEMYDGEVLASLSAIPQEYWHSHVADAESLREIVQSLPQNVDADLQRDVERLNDKLRASRDQ